MIEVLILRESVCDAGETILWCHPVPAVSSKARRVLYLVRGLDELGGRKMTGAKVLSGVAGFAVDLLSDSGGAEVATVLDVPHVIVSGASADCVAAAGLAEWQLDGGNQDDARKVVWMLTSHRLVMVEFTESEPSGSAPLRGLLKGSWLPGGGKSDDEDCAAADVRVRAEYPRETIASFDVVDHQLKGRSDLAYLRIAFQDGSTVDITDGYERRSAERMLAMSNGQA